jgi:DNA-directed RNA polymerase subunit M/transcription elongation factor TFIIS
MGKNNAGYECYECGGPMYKADEEVLVCSSCGHSVDIEDYGSEDEYDEYYDSVREEPYKNIPDGCKRCNSAAYPKCMTSCKVYDD